MRPAPRSDPLSDRLGSYLASKDHAPRPRPVNDRDRRSLAGGRGTSKLSEGSRAPPSASSAAFISRQLRGFATKQRCSCEPRPPWSTRPTCTSSRPSRSCSTFLRAAALAPSCRERHLDHAEAVGVHHGPLRDRRGRALLRADRAAARELRCSKVLHTANSAIQSQRLLMGARRSNSTPPSP